MVTRKYTNRHYLDQLDQNIMIFDGAMGTNLQMQNLTAKEFGGEITQGCNDYLVITYPKAVETVHRSFLEVGIDVLKTCTFRANRVTLGEYGLHSRVTEINEKAASLARRLADEYTRKTNHQRFVSGSIGPSGKLPSMNDPELSNIDFDEIADIFREQATGLIRGGVDLILLETSQDILELKAAIVGTHQAFNETGIYLPIQAQVTLDTSGRMLLGTDIAAVLTILDGMSVDIIGMNCSTGPDYMRESIRYLSENSPYPISCIPNAGLPMNVDGQAVFPLEPQPFAETLIEFVEKFHINVVGGCCGTTPQHLKVLVDRIHGKAPVKRSVTRSPSLSSAVQTQPMVQVPAPFLIGERMNTQGSRKFKELVLAEDYEAMLSLADQQVENGAHGLDICVALTERGDEVGLIRKLIKTISPVVRAPLVIDTTELEVLEMALKTAPGRCLINSTNLEGGRTKMDRIFSLAKKYNAAVICLTIDEQGMAKTAQRKLEIARRIHDVAIQEFGLRPEDIVFDDLTFTLATGDSEFNNSAIETLDGIKLIKKELPGVLVSLGVSNCSFGLAASARTVLNSVLLYHAVQAGLDMAIVNPAQITPYHEIPDLERSLAEDLIFNHRPDALQKIIEHFEKNVSAVKEKISSTQAAMQSLSAEERLRFRIIHRFKDNIEQDIDEIILREPKQNQHETAVKVLNQYLLPGMKEVGEKFGAGELILPFVLQSAEVMKRAVSYLESYLEKQEGLTKGTLVLATVYGDVHDIGKNLVKTILSNNGFNVIDLGKQVPADTIISKAIEFKADAIGLSALLVSTSKQMSLIVNELQRRNLKIPVLIGGAAINQRFGKRILFTDQESFYDAGVFYCKDAFDGLTTMNTLSDHDQKPVLLDKVLHEAEIELRRAPNIPEKPSGSRLSNIVPAPVLPVPTQWGARLVQNMPLDAVFQYLGKNELFRLSWGAKNTHGDAWIQLEADMEARLEEMRRQVLAEKWLKPQGVYGYWPVQSDGDNLIIFNPNTINTSSPKEIFHMTFPRQLVGENLCLADYFSPVLSGKMDVVAFQVVTVGQQATEKFNQLQESGDYSNAYYTHGLAVQMAEAAAEYLHRHIRRELGLNPDQGKRYSWGFPAIPDLSDHEKVFRLLPAEKELGMSLTSAFQLVPEQSTAAIIVHHPDAKYYNIGETGIDQLLKG